MVAGKATATLTTALAGLATVQAFDQASPTTSDSLSITMTASVPNKITLQATPGLIPKDTGVSSLSAVVDDVNGYPVGGVQVAFSIINPIGSGEAVSPVVVTTAETISNGLMLGEARTSFTAGTQASTAQGVQIRASVVGYPLVVTEPLGVNLTSSSNDASVVIGGTAGSITFGQATSLGVNSNASAYVLPMSVQVADSSGNPKPGVIVNLSVWPIAWSTSSSPCTPDPDTPTSGTFFNEDINENLNLDLNEDGTRSYYFKPKLGTSVTGGTIDSIITPPNSAGGTLPGTVTTGSNGIATFDLTYTKTNALWIVDRIRARTSVQGSETVGETSFRLGALESDLSPCRLPPSPYHF